MSDPQNPRDDDCELNYTKAPWIADARQVAAQLWCKPDTSHLVMDPALFEHIVQLVAGLKIEIAVVKAENFSAVLNSAESKEPLEIKLLPALTAELKAELLEFLVVCSTMHPFVVGDGIHKQSQRLITKLTNLIYLTKKDDDHDQ